jgi:hypothetical protein
MTVTWQTLAEILRSLGAMASDGQAIAGIRERTFCGEATEVSRQTLKASKKLKRAP